MDTNDELRVIMASAPLTLVQVSILTNAPLDEVCAWCVGQKMQPFKIMPKEALSVLKAGISCGLLLSLGASYQKT